MARVKWIVLLGFMGLIGCEGKIITEADVVMPDENNNNGTTELTFLAIQSQVFTPSCATSGCHTGPNPQFGLNLSAGQAYANIVNVNSLQNSALKLIDPGNSANSYLVRKLRGQNINGSRMPNGRSTLSNSVIDSIADWVDNGAPDN